MQKKYEEARALYQQALVILKESLGNDHEEVAETLNNLGHLCTAQGLHQEALKFYEQALVIIEKAFSTTHPKFLSVKNNISNAALKAKKAG
jgi:tetratricopeptide (TPR) repeat protein